MKVLHLSVNDISGGAARASYRLHLGLKSIGIHSEILSYRKNSNDSGISSTNSSLLRKLYNFAMPHLDKLPLMRYKIPDDSYFSVNWLPDLINTDQISINFDIINLHWIGDGFVSIRSLGEFRKPVVWTLHDMWAFTGGCHYSAKCDNYKNGCGKCPQLNSNKSFDITRKIFNSKKINWRDINFTIVTPSYWLADCAKQSSLLKNKRIKVIPYGLDICIFKSIKKEIARNILNLPGDKILILFGSIGNLKYSRKGFQYLLPTLQLLESFNFKREVELLIFGSSAQNIPIGLNTKINFSGKIDDDIHLSLLYSAADVFVAPSIEDNLPNTVLESLACGTPVVAFSIGGMTDMIEHQKNGYLARPFDTSDLAYGIEWVIGDTERYIALSQNARQKIEKEFTLDIQARRYLQLYNEILENNK